MKTFFLALEGVIIYWFSGAINDFDYQKSISIKVALWNVLMASIFQFTPWTILLNILLGGFRINCCLFILYMVNGIFIGGTVILIVQFFVYIPMYWFSIPWTYLSFWILILTPLTLLMQFQIISLILNTVLSVRNYLNNKEKRAADKILANIQYLIYDNKFDLKKYKHLLDQRFFEKVLDKFEKEQIKTTFSEILLKKIECDSDCTICLGDFEIENFVTTFPGCNHMFHHDCIMHWLNADKNFCPNDRILIRLQMVQFYHPNFIPNYMQKNIVNDEDFNVNIGIQLEPNDLQAPNENHVPLQ